MTGRDRAGERGTALIELVWLAILLLVPLLYIVMAVFEVQRASFGVTAAARSAGRAFVLAPGPAVAEERARAAATVALADQGIAADLADLAVTCRPDPQDCLSPGSVVEVRIGYPVRLPLVPSALGADAPSFRVSALHRAPYGTFREDRS